MSFILSSFEGENCFPVKLLKLHKKKGFRTATFTLLFNWMFCSTNYIFSDQTLKILKIYNMKLYLMDGGIDLEFLKENFGCIPSLFDYAVVFKRRIYLFELILTHSLNLWWKFQYGEYQVNFSCKTFISDMSSFASLFFKWTL